MGPKAIYRAENADMALARLEQFEAEWGQALSGDRRARRRAWPHVVPFFAFAPGIRKMIYTTNAVQALHRSLRKIIFVPPHRHRHRKSDGRQ